MANTKTERATTRRSAAGAKRRVGREDRDGDVSMDVGVKGRSKIGKAPSGPKGAAPPTGPAATRGRSIKGAALNGDQLQRHFARAAAGNDVSVRESKSAPRGSLVEFKVTGWENSTYSDNGDRGVAALINWLEKRIQKKLGSASRRPVKFKKWSVDGDVLSIRVPEADAEYLQRLDGFQWGQVKLAIQRVGGLASESSPDSNNQKTKAMFESVLKSRYNASTKILDLSSLGQEDPGLEASTFFDKKYTASKGFSAMMKVLQNALNTKEELNDAIESVRLNGNQLEDLTAVTSLAQTLPQLKNLDLSNNRLSSFKSLDNWRRKFYNLRHLIISGNPLEQNEPNHVAEFLKWYPNLQFINNVLVRTEEEIASKSSITNTRFPIRHSLFQDEDRIAETFVRNFVAGFDTNREGLVAMYYDDASDFSFALNTSAPRDPAGTVQTTPHEWDAYIKGSRNLKKISQLPVRQRRLFRGAKAIAGILTAMPKTRHPDLINEGRKWSIECHIQSGIPDITGRAPNGVDGFTINIHGEYYEVDPDTDQPTKRRSVDHHIQLGPAFQGVLRMVRVVSHQMIVRAYGGAQAFEWDDIEGGHTGSPTPADQAPLPEGVTVELAQQMVTNLSEQTSMTLEYSKICLVQCAWDFAAAQQAFERVRENLPVEAFLPRPSQIL